MSQPTLPNVDQWNWGAFLLTPVWAVFNRVWIGLLALIPIVGIFITFYLGTKGNDLAWRARQWESVEQFHRIQKRWAIVSILIITLGALIYLIVALQYINTLNAEINAYAI